MYKAEEIEAKLIKTKNSSEAKDYVAIAITVDDDGNAVHSGLIISYNTDTFYFHYDKESVPLKKVDLTKAENVFHKQLEIINEKLVPSFYNHCRIIEATASPIYGYFYGGSFFENGVYHSTTNSPQLMTCVGFCINVLTGFLEERKYIEFTDWQPVSEKAEEWFNEFIIGLTSRFPDLDITELKKEFRRIKPSELISSGYFNKLPIRKMHTDSIKPLMEQLLKSSS